MNWSKRQLEVITLLCDGRAIKQIAHDLGIGSKSVETHIEAARRKVGANNSNHLCAIFERLKHETANKPSVVGQPDDKVGHPTTSRGI